MSLIKQNILSVDITSSSEFDVLEYIKSALDKVPVHHRKPVETRPGHITITTPNPEQLMLANRLPWFRTILNQSDIALPDGFGLIVAARVLGRRGPVKRISGIDFMQMLIGLAEKNAVPIALIGGRDGVALKAIECLHQKHPKLVAVAMDGPELTVKDDGTVSLSKHLKFGAEYRSKSNNTQPAFAGVAAPVLEAVMQNAVRIVFIGLGAPKQEWFMASLKKELQTIRHLSPVILMSVGGSFDILAGMTPRAPKIFRYAGIEWLWRLALQPSRWRRQTALPVFIWHVLLEKFNSVGAR
jgi:N-acetylglucosaminyldiphosphoundecaprenol N-acetyl-beta-D-mannosaminyltransferase